MILAGDNLVELKKLADNSVDSIVTDPPYGLSFMGKKWDYDVPSKELWIEALRVLKPGGHLLAFGGTRTYHRLVVNIEDAGFEIRDQIQWLYGSGFPKSHNISKSIDKFLEVEPTVVGKIKAPASTKRVTTMGRPEHSGSGWNDEPDLTEPTTEAAKQWRGWGTALKPANEPICLARKPLEKALTVAENVLKYGTGALNIDVSRVGENPGYSYKNGPGGNSFSVGKGVDGTRTTPVESTQGRWPANIILDEEAAEVLDVSTGLKDAVSRFFYVAKASKKERGEGNNHPTVKPVKLMQYLIKLVTPQGGTVLDPFMGSGTTGVAAKELGFEFIGIELEKAYCEIAEKRVEAVV